MRKLIYPINLSLDGVCEHTKVPVSEEMFDFYMNLFQNTDLLVYGRITYEIMVPYWPDIAKNPSGETETDVKFARAFVATEKLVFSKTLERVDDENTRVTRAGLKDEILKLKGEQGKDIMVGGVDIPGQLTELGLIDEYIVVVAPVVVGMGRRLFENVSLEKRMDLILAGTESFGSGHVALRYLKK